MYETNKKEIPDMDIPGGYVRAHEWMGKNKGEGERWELCNRQNCIYTRFMLFFIKAVHLETFSNQVFFFGNSHLSRF